MEKTVTFTVTVFTRHHPDCPKKEDRYWKRCKCRKALYVYENGHDQIISAKTRSWDQAERLARIELAKRDPAEIERRRIHERDAEREAAMMSKNITVVKALSRWRASRKTKNDATSRVHATFERKVTAWAARAGIEYRSAQAAWCP